MEIQNKHNDDKKVINLDDIIKTNNTSGLANVHSTCYINTAIQCLGYCPQFFKFIIAGSPRKPNTPLTNELKEIFVELWIQQNAIAPMKFLQSLSNTFGALMNIKEQNDVSEFVILYLDKLNTDLAVELLVENDDINKIKKTNKKS
jgi:ubiquitin C-terminal hydrolase